MGYQGGISRALTEPWASINKESGKHKRIRGSFGLMGTTADYWRFAQMIANGGELNSVRVLSSHVVRYMVSDHLGALDLTDLAAMQKGVTFGLGFGIVKDISAAGFMGSEESVYWDGAATTLWWADPKEDLVVVAMTQYLDSLGPNLHLLRPQLRALVYGALTD